MSAQQSSLPLHRSGNRLQVSGDSRETKTTINRRAKSQKRKSQLLTADCSSCKKSELARSELEAAVCRTMSLARLSRLNLSSFLQGERMNVKRSALITFFCCIFSIFSFAQKNEFALSIGAIHSSDQTVTLVGIVCPAGLLCGPQTTSTSTGVAFEGNYARQLVSFGGASLGVEVPIVGIPGRDVNVTTFGVTASGAVSTWTFYLTPSARLKFHAGPIEPFVSLGGGWAHFGTTFNFATPVTPGVPVDNFSVSSSANRGVLQFGGGADFKTPLPHLAVRAEVRDFWGAGIAQPSNLVTVSPAHQHNIFAAGGVVFRF